MNHLLALLAATATLAVTAHAHQHLAAGFSDTNANGRADAGEPLRLVNPPAASVVFRLLPRATGNYAGYLSLDEFPRALHPNDYFTFTVLSDGQAEIRDPRHPATGSQIWMEITGVTGPAEGLFGFWEAGRSYEASSPTVSFPANQPTGDYSFILSEPLVPGDPAEDPYGHIHDRGWTATVEGVYRVSFRIVDRSRNGPASGPIHAPSPTYTFTFVAGENTPLPTPTPTPTPDAGNPTLTVAGGKVRTATSPRVVLSGQINGRAAPFTLEVTLNGRLRKTTVRTVRWTHAVTGLKPGPNRLTVRVRDAAGQASAPQTLSIRRLR